jgi:hypothetical protein
LVKTALTKISPERLNDMQIFKELNHLDAQTQSLDTITEIPSSPLIEEYENLLRFYTEVMRTSSDFYEQELSKDLHDD